MNRSILIVICDFLLLTLLTFSTDLSRINDEDAPRTVEVDNEKDITAVMRQALNKERQDRAQLQAELAKTRAEADERAKQFAATQMNFDKLNQQIQTNSTEAQVSKEKLAALEAK